MWRRQAEWSPSLERLGRIGGVFQALGGPPATKLTRIAEAWEKLVPELLSRHCALEDSGAEASA